ncbi:hypothetical protein GB927_033215 [Shinella sp. CPCC 100929]|uniref:Uncharacterized protein n=1 Tax=Shinella lacus TaxID=2654216 RepID=A0ABT1RIB2_9HYPH|nr:hypothetical protein [Shinella lacus]MCQ4634927.1 hypothetical protein [Shinella lacus]
MEKEKELKFGDDIVGALDNWGEKALVPVSIIAGKHLEVSQVNREKFKDNDIRLTEAHAFAWSALGNLISRSAGAKIKEDSDVSQRLNLISHFLQSINLCEVAVVEGLYLQAATLRMPPPKAVCPDLVIGFKSMPYVMRYNHFPY